MTKAILIFACLLISPLAFAQSKSFDLYAQGKVTESIVALKEELKTGKPNAAVLTSEFERLLSIYRTHPEISDAAVIEILNLMRGQSAANNMAGEMNLMQKEIEYFRDSKPSIKQTANYLTAAIRSGKDTSIISNDPQRIAKINMVRLFASRQIKSNTGADRANWTYLAGKAGFYQLNRGNADLKFYLQQCEHLGKTEACANTRDAQSMLKLGKSIENVNPR